VDWVKGFYSRTGAWWGRAEAHVGERDHRRVALLHEHTGQGPKRVLELGSGYGTTAVAAAMAGHTVTAVEISDRADLLVGTGLQLVTITSPTAPPDRNELLREQHEYLAVLNHRSA
jgi:tRNA/tmRNA/rRNA uracil-C5-methylase (TrmA/RlmC/RlmD family)